MNRRNKIDWDWVHSALSREHEEHQEEYPGNSHPDCPVCKFQNGTLFERDEEQDERDLR